ncbi:hypothetical protein [Marinobacter sp. F4206]|uniref:hypothetical protein n=1 Tax=Marinobacter sp. F4206 TaxID=2861777 RepID=UPI001C607C64|nr:hypothetical protein [Marinobacter sp. F4206]MBW4936168.1 hypothetical protein [Marinobacter sp. F4206]
MSSYFSLLKDANNTSKKLGASGVSLPESELAPLLTDEKMEALASLLVERYGPPAPSKLAHKCLAIHYELLEDVEKIIGVKPIFTIGHMNIHGEEYWRITEDQLLEMSRSPSFQSKRHLHAWLSLPSSEIIDFTFPASYVVETKYSGEIGVAITKHHSELQGMSYHPVALGEEVLYRTGLAAVTIGA